MFAVTMLLALVLVLGLSCNAAETLNSSSITFHYRIWEELPLETQVGSLSDDLRKHDELGHLEGFQVVEHGKTLPFAVDAQDGVISTQGRLDREQLCRNSDVCELAFSVLYRKGGDVNCLRVHVEIMDLNDNSPGFPNPLQELDISETAALRMRIPLEHALDPDAGPNGLQTYSLSTNTHFALDVTVAPGGTKQAELVIVKELDREVKDVFELTLVAWDKGNPPRSGSTLVRVKIQDSNDNSPTFEDSAPLLELPEDTEIGTVIINLKAVDPDEGANGLVEYSISKHTRPETKRVFTIDSQTGAVSLKALLDYEDTSSHEVIVQARDRGPNSIPSHCKLHVKVIDVNDNAPRIHATWTTPNSPGPNVLEGAEIGTFLALVLVSDADSEEDGEIEAMLKEMSGPFQLQQMQRNNYKIVTSGWLDREDVSKYTITIIAQDKGNPPLQSVYQLPVHVLDQNDNAPIFSTPIYKTEINENNEQDYRALKVEAYDLDIELSGRVSYSIQNANDYPFSIHRSTGVITIHHSLDYEEAKSYSLIVEAADHGYPPLSSTAKVEIQVLDVNDNYPIIVEPKSKKGIASVSVPVNAEKGEIVAELGNSEKISIQVEVERFLALTIKATDLDEGINSELRYALSKENNHGLFSMDEMSGNLYVNTTNATELIGKTFKVDLTVQDDGTPSLLTKTTLEITFTNLKDHLKSSSDGSRNHLSFTMMLAICLGATCLLLLLAVALVTTFCRPVKRENRAYNCRHAESTYTRHPRRPQKNIRKSDIQLIPVIRGRKDDPSNDDSECQPLSPPSAKSEELQNERQYTLTPSCLNTSFHSQSYQDINGSQPSIHHGKTLCKPGNIELDSPLVITPASSYRTLRKSRNQSSSSSASHASTLKRQKSEESNVSQATLRRQKTEGQSRDAEQQMWRNLVRLSMAAFGDAIELSAASPDVQQISQLLSLLRQGQLQPRTNFRGNKFSHRRCGGQDCGDWQSTKDSGHGESEPGDGDMGWDGGPDCPLDTQLEEGLRDLINTVQTA
ncbi:protocadherin-12 [Eucyclogobius newberryi]|uniref:protocadherin-12 n=1 Tax=Eucyclogobius newberryi TaxID=166745 RepID=UPI003B5B86A8